MKKQLKLFLLLALALVTVFAFAACGGDGEGTTAPSNDGTTAPQGDVTTAPQGNVTTAPDADVTTAPDVDVTTAPDANVTTAPDANVTTAPDANVTTAPDANVTTGSEPGVTTGGAPSQEFTFPTGEDRTEGCFYIIFVGKNPVTGEDNYVLGTVEVKSGRTARLPEFDEPDGWEHIGWSSEAWKKVKADAVVYADYDTIPLHTVTFVDADGSEIEKVQVYSKKGVTELPKVSTALGRYFVGWGEYKDNTPPTTVSTIYNYILADVTLMAIYKPTTAVAPFVTDKIVVDGDMDAAYQAYSKKGEGYANTFNLFYDSENFRTAAPTIADNGHAYSSFWKLEDTPEGNPCGIKLGGGDGKSTYTTNTATAYVIWNGATIYFLVEVTDATLGGRSFNYIKNTINAYLNDTVELFYNFEKEWTSDSNRMKIGIDALGVRRFGDSAVQTGSNLASRTMSTWFDDIEFATKVLMDDGTWTSVNRADTEELTRKDTGAVITLDQIADKYRVEFAIPAKTEAPIGSPDEAVGVPPAGFETLEAYDVLHCVLQNNDIVDWSKTDAALGNDDAQKAYYNVRFTANGRTQYYYPEYDTISLAGPSDQVGE